MDTRDCYVRKTNELELLRICVQVNSTQSSSILLLQAARRLSVNVSRRASSVVQFFQYKEELRTAKISILVLIVAFLCWGPFFVNLAISGLFFDLNLQVIQALHYLTNLTMLSFAALSPYLYVFRSRKVQKCLGQVLHDTFCIWELSLVHTRRRNLVAHRASMKNQLRNNPVPTREQERKCQHHIGK